jgi:Rieske Fe-S protein
MKRKAFIRSCCLACMGGTFVTAILEGCSANNMISGTIENSDLVVPVNSFHKNDSFRKYVIAQPEILKYPICIFRLSDTEYTALLMRCTHQGTQLEIYGDRLECPAHGSEFDQHGDVIEGPAQRNLRTFPVRISDNHLYISLKQS